MQYELNIKEEKYRITIEALSSKRNEPGSEPSLAELRDILDFIALPKAPHYICPENTDLFADTCRQIPAPLPGTIIHVAVKQGETVQKGDLLLVLEAMKMENEICAPASGVIREILAEPGDTVKTNAILVVLE